MIIFKYDKKIDQECWDRLIEAENLFGHSFPKSFNILDSDIQQAIKKEEEFKKVWEDCNINLNEGINKIYRFDPPKKLICYINTSDYSMDNYEKGYISVSMRRDTPEKMVTTIVHEISHFIFREYYIKFCLDIGCSLDEIENIKEIITVINNIVFNGVKDDHWENIHALYRKNALQVWEDTFDIKKVILSIKDMMNACPI
jgi:hypothetical protein